MRRIRDQLSERGTPDVPELAERVREMAHPLWDMEALDPLLKRIGDARCVLLGGLAWHLGVLHVAGPHQSAADPREGLLLHRRRGGLARLL